MLDAGTTAVAALASLFGCEVDFPEAVGCTVSDDDGYPLMEYRDVGFGESYLASLVAE